MEVLRNPSSKAFILIHTSRTVTDWGELFCPYKTCSYFSRRTANKEPEFRIPFLRNKTPQNMTASMSPREDTHLSVFPTQLLYSWVKMMGCLTFGILGLTTDRLLHVVRQLEHPLQDCKMLNVLENRGVRLISGVHTAHGTNPSSAPP